ncbi:thioredoxin family protein [Candidatus Woesearchaeota archaeon]|nr:thioredoxin family protein [Candidatus Woesearchaeota archaeon]MBW3005273.1 thioredoxin family protein [Candidatus Woesearchaeota archaeon]
MKKHKKNTKNEDFYKIDKKTAGYCLLGLIVILIIAGLFYYDVIELPESEEKKEEKAILDNFTITAEAPEVELYVIENSECTHCMNASTVIELIKGAPALDIKSDKILEYDSDEGKELIEEYELKRLPAFVLKIVSGETLEEAIPPFENRKGAMVYDMTPPPYYDVEADEIKGVISVTKVVNSGCEDCFDLEALIGNLKMFGLAVGEETTVEFDSDEGKELVEKYGITKVPTLIFSKDAKEYDQISSAWEEIGTTEDDGMMVLRTVNPPYYDIETDSVKGIVSITHLTDESCEDCFDTAMIKNMFEQQLMMKYGSEKTVDISSEEGKKLLEDYEITKVPTVILSGDAEEYPGITGVWDQIGSVVNDEFVITKLETIPGIVYKDLETDEIVGLKEETTDDSEEEPEEESSEENETA